MIVSLKKTEVCIQEYLTSLQSQLQLLEVLHFIKDMQQRIGYMHSLTRAEEK